VFDIRDEFAGLTVKCPACGGPVTAAVRVDPAPIPMSRRDVPDSRRRPIVSAGPTLHVPGTTARPPAPSRTHTRPRKLLAPRGASRFRRTGPKERHGCLTAWLCIIVLLNSLALVGLFYLQDAVALDQPALPRWILLVSMLLCSANVACAVALLNWKKWGFLGICITTTVAATLNVVTSPKPLQIVGGFIGVAVLYGVLQMGGKRSAWSQLE